MERMVPIDDAADEEERAPEKEWYLDTLLQELNVPAGALVDLADVVNGPKAPQRRPGYEQIQAVPG